MFLELPPWILSNGIETVAWTPCGLRTHAQRQTLSVVSVMAMLRQLGDYNGELQQPSGSCISLQRTVDG